MAYLLVTRIAKFIQAMDFALEKLSYIVKTPTELIKQLRNNTFNMS